mgnify:FL=1
MAIPPNFYNVADQKLYKEGLFYKPQERFTLPYNQASLDDENSVEPEGILSANVVNNFTNNGGSGFSVYNPDPSSIVNRNYNPKPNYDAYYEDIFGKNLGDPEVLGATGAKYADPSKLQGFASALTNFIPGKGIAQFLGSYAPPNRRSIFENQLSGQGIMVDNIGRIVQGQGDYNTAGNIMAGYNASKVDADTFQKRRDMINEKMKDPVQKEAKLKALDEAEKRMLDTATTQTNKIYDFEEEEKEKLKNNNFLAKIFKRDEKTKPVEPNNPKKEFVEAAKAGIKKQKTKTNDGGSKTGFGGYKNVTEYDTANKATYDRIKDMHNYAKGGRIGYFFGGLAARRMKR